MRPKEKYVVQDFINNEFPEFETIKECEDYIIQNFTDEKEGIHPDVDDMFILKKVSYVFVDEQDENDCKIAFKSI